jgi:hypothetical protein
MVPPTDTAGTHAQRLGVRRTGKALHDPPASGHRATSRNRVGAGQGPISTGGGEYRIRTWVSRADSRVLLPNSCDLRWAVVFISWHGFGTSAPRRRWARGFQLGVLVLADRQGRRCCAETSSAQVRMPGDCQRPSACNFCMATDRASGPAASQAYQRIVVTSVVSPPCDQVGTV